MSIDSLIRSWDGTIVINGVEIPKDGTSHEIGSKLDFSKPVDILLKPKTKVDESVDFEGDKAIVEPCQGETNYVVTVKQYMTRKATPEFDFMAKWNNDNPMPLRVMVGTKLKETRGMVYMVLHGDILSERTQFCMRCGRPITNQVSQFFGLGPECGGHNYVNPFDSQEELEQAVKLYRAKLRKTTWEGWIIKSAIESLEVYNEKNLCQDR